MQANIVKVSVLGRRLSVRTDASAQELAATVSYLEKRAETLKSAASAADPANLSILLNIVLADEIMQLKRELENIRKTEFYELEQAEKLTNELIHLISRELD
jgi:cell division protein ZapA (FtsZ GTPase activity inhibitor)